MAKSPADRYQSTAEMLADLQAVVGTLSGQVHIALPSESGMRSASGGRQDPGFAGDNQGPDGSRSPTKKSNLPSLGLP